MILNEIDLMILREFCKSKKEESKTTWNIMKKIYPKGGDSEHSRIYQRIKKMNHYGFFIIDEKNCYLLKEKVRIINIKFPYSKDKTRALAIKYDNKWNAIEL